MTEKKCLKRPFLVDFGGKSAHKPCQADRTGQLATKFLKLFLESKK